MCGIAGILSKNGVPPDERLLRRMRDTLRHRGPDDAGSFCQAGIALGHRRLSILDVTAAGHQPMSTPDGRFTIVFNGEIYNFRQLRARYLSDVPLVSASDTEVLLHLLARHGLEVLVELRGMFAFAMWDNERETLWLARDPFGKKPLYIQDTPTAFYFASEIKALLGQSRPALDPQACAHYFLYEYVPAPRSPFSGIEQLPLGHYCQVTKGGWTLQRWWQPRFNPKLAASPVQALTVCDTLLETAVARRLVSDVPVGVLLSGGIDSTTIAWYVKKLGYGPLHTFSVAFKERSFDETHYASQAATALGTQHHTLPFSLTEFKQALTTVTALMDTPLGDASMLPTTAISWLARQHVTVLLDGDGSDELLGGYGIFPAAALAERLRWLPQWLTTCLQSVGGQLPAQYHNFSFDFKVKSFLRGLPYPLPARQQIWLGSFTDQELGLLLTPPYRAGRTHVFAPLDQLSAQLADLATADAVSLLLIYEYLHNDLLVKLDRAAMFASVEARTPFLDVDFANFATRLPSAWKRDKKILRQLMQERIPWEIAWRPKKGFGIPLGWWLKGPLHSWAKTVLSPRKLTADGIINPAVPQQLLAEHRRGRADHRKKLWTLLAWQLWYDQWVAQREPNFEML